MRFISRMMIIAIILAIVPASIGAAKKEQKTQDMRTPDVVYVGTPYDLVSMMLKMANVKKNDLVYDLGCGDGRMLVLAAQKYGSRGVGYDIDPERVQASRDNAARNKVAKLVEIIQGDIFTVDLSKVDVLPLYLLPEMNRKLIAQIDKMKPGSRIVCHDYGLDGIVADETRTVTSNEDNASHTLMLYTTPLKRQP
jgi:ribosomal protein L11 methylase PrmA